MNISHLLVYYIHANPQIHGLIEDFRDWEWSSYKRILMDTHTKLKKKEVLDWFGSKDRYVKYHHDYREDLLKDFNLGID